MTTKFRYLEVTYRNGKALAAYLYLPRKASDRSDRTQRMDEGLIVDFAADGRPIGVEITSPSHITVAALNSVLGQLNIEPANADELAPLAAA